MSRLSCLLVLLALFVRGLSAQAPPVISPHTDAAPAEIADSIEALLAVGGQQVKIGDNTLQFWWVKSLPLKSDTTGTAWTSVDEGALVGAVKVSAPFKDVRGAAIKPGTYTLRYSPRYLLLLPVDADTSVSALGHDNVFALSKLTTRSAFPAALSLDPPAAAGRSGRRNRRAPATVTFTVPASRDGADAGSIKFDLGLAGLTAS